YFLGAIPTAYIIAKKISGINIMEHGSGNVGTTNIFRVLGWRVGLPVFAIDMAKGFIATWLGYLAGGNTVAVFAAFIAVIGHTFSVFIGFKGGKGVATGAGTLLFLCPRVFICVIIMWFVISLVSGYISLGSIVASLSAIIFVIAFGYNAAICVFVTIAALYVVYKHHSNIKRLLNGKESKVNWRKVLKRNK
ncbi:MAG: glycerol-3-phosphate 1-O-acyltransferase PlsY, partial [Bacillota bacterium]|nr:glycerol-3-phosphate 1-O-acyltransferase PlsY [Bacillota bacterium]